MAPPHDPSSFMQTTISSINIPSSTSGSTTPSEPLVRPADDSIPRIQNQSTVPVVNQSNTINATVSRVTRRANPRQVRSQGTRISSDLPSPMEISSSQRIHPPNRSLPEPSIDHSEDEIMTNDEDYSTGRQSRLALEYNNDENQRPRPQIRRMSESSIEDEDEDSDLVTPSPPPLESGMQRVIRIMLSTSASNNPSRRNQELNRTQPNRSRPSLNTNTARNLDAMASLSTPRRNPTTTANSPPRTNAPSQEASQRRRNSNTNQPSRNHNTQSLLTNNTSNVGFGSARRRSPPTSQSNVATSTHQTNASTSTHRDWNAPSFSYSGSTSNAFNRGGLDYLRMRALEAASNSRSEMDDFNDDARRLIVRYAQDAYRNSSTSSQPASSVHSHFRYKVVCQLECKHCLRKLCARAMKAILLADTKVELYSTDKPPMGVQLVNEDYITGNCHCRIHDVACLGCGNVVGYHVTQPCESCLDSCNNGHFWMFQMDGVNCEERTDASGSKPLLWAFLPSSDKDPTDRPFDIYR